ncbi:probable polyamine transporter At1g31830 isoform X1 [Cucumis melo]|nr:probable polyamine transporter At1g31830 isoform X1 [Cucumis melo]
MKTHQQEPPVSASQIHSVELDQKVFQPHSIPSAAASPHRNGAKEEPPIVSVSDSDHQTYRQEPPISASQIHSAELDHKELQPQSILPAAAAAAASAHCNGAKEEPPIVFVSDSDHQKLRTSPARQTSVSMGEINRAEYVSVGESPSPAVVSNAKKVSVLPLVFLIFYEVSGGPFGVEDSVGAAGPLLALLGFLVFPLIWSIPEALITAEMGTMFPENGGYVVWVSSALGPFWGFQQGWMKWLSGVIDNALYPVLFLDYLKSEIPALGGGLPRVAAVLALTVILTYMNYRGLTIVGWVAVILGVFSILPFAVMGLVSIPKLRPARWVVVNLKDVDWNLYLNTLFWNLNYWDSISTLAGEVENPNKTLPKALFYALILVVLSYFLPLLSGTGAIALNRELWTDGYFSDVAKIIGGAWLGWWIQGAAAMSNMGMFVAEMSSDSFQLLGMAERGMLPEFFSKRSRHGTPLIGILFSASGVVLLSWLSFQEIVAAENFLYCFGMILEFLAFIKLRIKHPAASRPYKIPVGTAGSILMCIPPTILICIVLALSTVKVMIVSLAAVAIGLLLQPGLKYVEKKRWLKFSVSADLPDLHFANRDRPDTLVY